jgi:uncharacterized membrane protein YeaQ/YmgE (transglycosylase-associated protein family)
MSIAIWMLAGAVLGWIGRSYLGFNEDRSALVVILIGGFGGLLGGNVLAPMFLTPAAVPGAISVGAMVVAMMASATCLYAGNFVSSRFGV